MSHLHKLSALAGRAILPLRPVWLRAQPPGLPLSRRSITVGDVKARTRAGTGCGGCLPLVTDLLKQELEAAGRKVINDLCEHFPLHAAGADRGGIRVSGESYGLMTFPVKVDDGRVYLELPPEEQLDAFLGTDIICRAAALAQGPARGKSKEPATPYLRASAPTARWATSPSGRRPACSRARGIAVSERSGGSGFEWPELRADCSTPGATWVGRPSGRPGGRSRSPLPREPAATARRNGRMPRL